MIETANSIRSKGPSEEENHGSLLRGESISPHRRRRRYSWKDAARFLLEFGRGTGDILLAIILSWLQPKTCH